jgi:pyridoxal phosphate enzyme (YggS family)
LIGHLQSNKCRDAVHFFDAIQSVDSLALAHELNKWADKSAKRVPILLEINVAGESTKFGYPPEAFLAELRRLNELPRLELQGLMTLAPWTPEPDKVRPVFRRLRELKDESEQILGASLTHLSMGMSGDFDVAIEEGATLIRVNRDVRSARKHQAIWRATGLTRSRFQRDPVNNGRGKQRRHENLTRTATVFRLNESRHGTDG